MHTLIVDRKDAFDWVSSEGQPLFCFKKLQKQFGISRRRKAFKVSWSKTPFKGSQPATFHHDVRYCVRTGGKEIQVYLNLVRELWWSGVGIGETFYFKFDRVRKSK